jgi:hypothetical protein
MGDELSAQQDSRSDGEKNPDSADPKPDVIHARVPSSFFCNVAAISV